ncbi:DUF5129 domain-containing protein [Streptomyces albidoflavus]|uniref:DUF5129 domain-containing protein n=1 Tax=Streptomyces albidoflavus TaxID=1886 RepID=UPI0021D5B8E9|nr:DUF5129 domain-containing protein [Streptomyces albidoflavus]MCU7705169.1 DUF5129 domain-containing protein [Streptomyces albidoflavus]
MSDSRDTSPTAPPLLPVGGAELRRDPALHEAVRRAGQRVGVDFTDDERVREELRRGHDALAGGSATTGPGCLAFLLLIVAAGLAVADQISPPLTVHRPALLAGAGVCAVLAVAAMGWAVARWQRARRDPVLAAYREVLALAQAHGLALTHVPDWLVGKAGGSSQPWYPLPEVAPPGTATGTTPPPPPSAPRDAGDVRPPHKPAEVTAWERTAGQGGWHDELGGLLALAGAGAAVWAYVEDQPVGYAGLVLGLASAIAVWVLGHLQGVRKERGREAALRHLADLRAAQAAGAAVPELSPQLRRLLEEDGTGG